MSDIVIFKGVRYLLADARRLGIPTDGKVITQQSREIQRHHHASTEKCPESPGPGPVDPEPEPTPDPIDGEDSDGIGEQTLAQPSRGGSKVAWQEYARAQGMTEDEIDGLSRDELADLFTN